MSSIYRPICMSHEPALVINSEYTDRTLFEAVLANPTSADPGGDLERHAGCDLLGGAFSYPLVEVYCPPRKAPVIRHTYGHWIDVGWLRLVHLTATTWPNSEALAQAHRALPMCWQPHRVARLAAEL